MIFTCFVLLCQVVPVRFHSARNIMATNVTMCTLVQCPYDPYHEVKISRMQTHLLRCKPRAGYTVCEWNCTHVYKIGEVHNCETNKFIQEAKMAVQTANQQPVVSTARDHRLTIVSAAPQTGNRQPVVSTDQDHRPTSVPAVPQIQRPGGCRHLPVIGRGRGRGAPPTVQCPGGLPALSDKSPQMANQQPVVSTAQDDQPTSVPAAPQMANRQPVISTTRNHQLTSVPAVPQIQQSGGYRHLSVIGRGRGRGAIPTKWY